MSAPGIGAPPKSPSAHPHLVLCFPPGDAVAPWDGPRDFDQADFIFFPFRRRACDRGSGAGSIERRQGRRAIEGMANLRPRLRRHALFAADGNHARQCRTAQSGVGLSHEASRCGRAGSSRPCGRCRRRARRRPSSAVAGDAADRGFSPSENTPLVIDGTMYMSTPYSRVVALDPTTGKEIWAFHLPSSSPSTRGIEYWAGDGQTPPQIVFGSSDGKLYSLDAKTGKPNNAFGDNGVVNLNTPEIMQGSARPQRAEFAAHRVQEPCHHRRHDAGESAAWARGRRARLGHAHGQARLDFSFHPARGRKIQRHLGRR